MKHFRSSSIPVALGMLAVAAFLAVSAQLAGPAGSAFADLPDDLDDVCEMEITKTNNTGGDIDEDESFVWRLDIEWDDDCNNEDYEVDDNIPGGFDVTRVTESGDGDLDCDNSDPINCDGTANGGPGEARVSITVRATGSNCGDRTNTASLEWTEGDDEDSDEVDVDCDEDIVIIRPAPTQPLAPLPRPVAVASAPAPAPAPAVVAPAPAPAVAPQLPRAGEGPMQQDSGNSTLPLGAGLLVVAGLGLAYWRLSRSR